MYNIDFMLLCIMLLGRHIFFWPIPGVKKAAPALASCFYKTHLRWFKIYFI